MTTPSARALAGLPDGATFATLELVPDPDDEAP